MTLKTGRGVRWAGLVCGFLGSGAVALGTVLPWARFSVWGVPVAVPGVAGLGALALVAALLVFFYGRRFPLLAVLLGLALLTMGGHAQQETGRRVKGHLLQLQQALVPVNDKLMRAGLPPVEPFAYGQPARAFVGPGPAWTFWGGAGVAVGFALVFAAGRVGQTCSRCGSRWGADRKGTVAFCPACGGRAGPSVVCLVCRSPAQPGDKFCVACGHPLSR